MLRQARKSFAKKSPTLFTHFLQELSQFKVDFTGEIWSLRISLTDVPSARQNLLFEEICTEATSFAIVSHHNLLGYPIIQLEAKSELGKAFLNTFFLLLEDSIAKKFSPQGSISLFWQCAKKRGQLKGESDDLADFKGLEDIQQGVKAARSFVR